MDRKQMKLGRSHIKHDSRTLKLSNYLNPKAISAPSSCTYSLGPSRKTVNWGMYANDTIGDCTIAAVGHIIEEGQLYNGQAITPTDTDIVAAYSAITGYNPADPNTDQGAACLDVLKYWQQNGICGNKIAAYLQLDITNIQQLKAAIFLFGAIYTGINLPVTCQTQDPWTVTSTTGNGAPGSWGGHCVPIMTYNSNWCTCITWGAPMGMSWGWWTEYGEEAYAVLDETWAMPGKNAPSGFNLAQLQADLSNL